MLYHQNTVIKKAEVNNLASTSERIIVDDLELWKNFQVGSEVAFATIYKNNVSLLYSYGFKLVNNKALIKDCIQDLFIEIWDSKQRLGNVRYIKAYLHKSFRRKLIAASVKQRIDYKISEYPNEHSLKSFSFEHSLIEKQNFDLQQQKLKESLQKLTDKQKEIIHLRYYARLSYIEISEIMSISKKGAYKLMGRSIEFLRSNMS
ncbi:RNA polymerase sigma factor [Flavivirga rizhaonensis]|uniref:Sigma-70 family RNA polymerase sigma factor n=1 Tax=Flavivirga rizhaonensis TaxID=2559571 RepID=A0A4S1DXB3_9FLAO|nr:sigma-70 family RNA polymerase sigma factor [Flavivirga rizhaonensis]TGV02585.1 sigma-70 family RNA polymerase sigma factor [Flavivirga rizhaonensis]